MLLCSVSPPTRIDHQIDALAVGQLHDRLGDVAGAVVDTVIHAERLQTFEPFVTRGGCEYGRARALGQLNRGYADAARARLHQYRLAGL